MERTDRSLDANLPYLAMRFPKLDPILCKERQLESDVSAIPVLHSQWYNYRGYYMPLDTSK
jgi:hypothetical protein